jgi:hypothetical protein
MAQNLRQYGRRRLFAMPSSSPPRPRWPSLFAPRGLARFAYAALALGALALVCSLPPSRRVSGDGAALAWIDEARLHGPFGTSLGVGGELSRARGAWRPTFRLRLHLALEVAPFGRGDR